MTSFTTPTEAPLYNALTGLSWGVGCILGPVIGGAFSVSSATWRWVRTVCCAVAFSLGKGYDTNRRV